jgi:transposase-like protein
VISSGTDWNEDDEKALQRRIQGEGCDGGDPGDLTLAELAAKHGVHHTMIGAWKRQAMDGMASLFDGGDQAAKASSEAEIEKLHAKIGQLLVERDFGKSLRSMSMDRRRKMVEPDNPDLSITAQCRLLSISRSGYYYAPGPRMAPRWR